MSVPTTHARVKVLVVDDSPTARQYLTHIFNATGTLQVIGTASNGQEALDFVRRTKPDIITMDINMPVMDGLEATREIMCTDPVPIVILSASWDPREVQQSFRAVEAGALASFAKPSGMASVDSAESTRELVANIEALARIKLVRRNGWASGAGPCSKVANHAGTPARRLRNPGVVVIGVSTGGPPVLQCILSRLARDFRFPVLIVQHISQGFSQGLVDWLRSSSALPIALGRQGDLLRPGQVVVAPDDCHLEVGGEEQVVLSRSEPEHGLRPAVSRLFHSAATVYGRLSIAVLLTGMGSDGARELLEIRDQGGVTIAQDERSCVVYGMPKVAVELHAVNHVLCPVDIAKTLNRLSAEPWGDGEHTTTTRQGGSL